MANDFATLGAGLWEDGSTVTASDLRRGSSIAVLGTTGATVRGGVKPARGNPLAVSAPGGMFARVAAGTGVVPGGTSEGGYVLTVPTNTDLQVTSANGTNPRIDTVGLEVVPGSPTTWRVRMLDGSPNASPVAPTYAVAGGFFLPLADVRVNALATSPSTITDRRVFTAAPGGIVYYPGFRSLSTAAQQAVLAALPQGTPVWDETNGQLGIATGTNTWQGVQLEAPKWGVKAAASGLQGVPSDNTFRVIPFTVLSDQIGTSAISSGRVNVPYTGRYTGYFRVQWQTGTSTSTGRRAQGLEIGGTVSRFAVIGTPGGHPNSTSFIIPFSELLTAGTGLGVQVWQESGVTQIPLVEMIVDLLTLTG